ncbi:MAG: hypothetical protein NVS4B8_05440 [Herpetosiphon sp.]
MNNTNTWHHPFRVALPIFGLAIALVGCGAGTTTPTAAGTGSRSATVVAPGKAATTSAKAQAPAAAADAAGGEVGGDAPLTAYTDPGGLFRFDYPQGWGTVTQSGESIRLTGHDEFISVKIVQTPLSPLEYAKQDAAALTSASPGFAGQPPKAGTFAGKSAATVAYTWQAGPSRVTGKPIPSSANRYYIPGTAGKLAVFTYSSPTRNYDPAGAVDFVNGFKWLK